MTDAPAGSRPARLIRRGAWVRRAAPALLTALLFAGARASASAQEPAAGRPDYSRNPEWFPRLLKPYQLRKVEEPRQEDDVDLSGAVRDGRLPLTVKQLREAVSRNDIDLAAARYNSSMAQTDILRARGGGAPRGVSGARIPPGLFAGAIGAGVGDTTTAGGGTGAGGITGSARQVFARPRGTYDPGLALNLSFDKTTSPLNTVVVAGLPEVTTRTTALQARLSQAFTSGTSVSVSINNQRQSSSQLFLRFNPSFVSSFSFVVTQQLLNGFGFGVNRRFLTVAENGIDIAREEERRQALETLARAESLYWELAAARDSVRVAQRALEVAQQLLKDNQAREDAGAVSGIEVVTAASEVSARRRDLIAAQAALDLRNADLIHTLSRKPSEALATARIEAVDALPDPSVEQLPATRDAQAEAFRSRPELRQAEGNIRNQEIAIRYTRSLLKPTLVIFATVNSAGLYGDRVLDLPEGGRIVLPGGLSQAFRQVRSFSYPEYAFGFSLQMPIGNRSAQADNIRARLERQQAEMTLLQTRTRIAMEVHDAIVALAQSKAEVQSASKAVELRRESLRAEEERLLAGTTTPYEVIRRQRDLTRAEYEEVRARADFAKARVELGRAVGKSGGD